MTRFGGVLSLASCLAFVASASAQGADPALSKLARSYEQAWQKGDAAAVAALYTEDALSVNSQGVQHGRPEIQKMLATNLAGPWKGTTLVVQVGRTQALGPDTAVHEGTYEVKGGKGPDGKPMTVKGSYFDTLVRKGGDWLIAGHMAFAPPPAGMATATK